MTTGVTELSLPDLVCPMPVLKAKKALAGLGPGALLRVRSTDRHSLAARRDFCAQTGHALVEQSESDEGGRHWFVTLIRRRD